MKTIPWASAGDAQTGSSMELVRKMACTGLVRSTKVCARRGVERKNHQGVPVVNADAVRMQISGLEVESQVIGSLSPRNLGTSTDFVTNTRLPQTTGSA
jgi:hypothetical protein